MIAEETIEEIKRRASLSEVVSEQVSLKRQGAQFVGLCPFHSEKTPSFHIRDDSFFHCFGCGESGTVITYVMRMRGLSFPEAIDELAQRFGITVKRIGGRARPGPDGSNRQVMSRINRASAAFFWRSMDQAPEAVRAYVTERSLRAEACRTFVVGYAPAQRTSLRDFLLAKKFSEASLLESGVVKRNQRGELYDTFRGRLMFPIFADNKRILGFGGRVIPALFDAETLSKSPKYLNSSETPLYHKSKVFYGLPQALAALRDEEEVFIVEGYLDVIALWQSGVRHVMATCGTALTEQHVDRLKRLVKRVVLLFDGDDAGRSAAAKSFQVFLNSGLDVVVRFLPEGEDPDTYAKTHGEETAQALQKLPGSNLLECFFRGLVIKYGATHIGELGAALKGKISAEIAAMLARVKNAVERAELIQQASLLLRVEPVLVEQLIAGGKSTALTSAAEKAVSVELGKQGEPTRRLTIAELPALDQEVLLATMAQKEVLPAEILEDADLCAALSPVSIMFIEGLAGVFANESSEADERVLNSQDMVARQKEHIRELLEQFGPSWKAHWKKAHLVLSDPSAQVGQIMQQCRASLRKYKLNLAIGEINRRIDEVQDEAIKVQLHQEKLQLTRQLQIGSNMGSS